MIFFAKTVFKCAINAYSNRYSPYTKDFQYCCRLKHARYNFSCARDGNLVYLFGGYGKDKKPVRSIEVVDLDAFETWIVNDLPVKDTFCEACIVEEY